VRSKAEAGKIAAKRRDGRWIIDGSRLPLSAEGKRAMQSRAQRMRNDLDVALPSLTARGASERTRSVVDLDAFRLLAQVVHQANELPLDVRALLEGALCDLGEAVLLFHTPQKAGPAERARRGDVHAGLGGFRRSVASLVAVQMFGLHQVRGGLCHAQTPNPPDPAAEDSCAALPQVAEDGGS
jgi:hypothetical protein